MCGTPDNPCMARIKAAKTEVLLGWVLDLLQLLGGATLLDESASDYDNRGSNIVRCCQRLKEFYAVLARESR
eukprot:5485482-Pyramimonas_sp.AAC.1